MAQLIALEWDSSEVRLAKARTYGSSIQVDHLQSVAITTSDDGKIDLLDAISSLVAESGDRTDVLLNIHRGDAELRLIELPSVPADELPDMVRLQAVRHFTALTDNWTVDFLPLESSSDDSDTLSVLAAAMDPAALSRIEETCQSAGLVPTHMTLRSFSSASAWLRHDSSASTCLLVDLLEQEVDLTVVHQGQVVLSRNVRLPRLETSQQGSADDELATQDDELATGDAGAGGDSGINMKLLQGEVRRTIVSANNQLANGRVEQIVMFGQDEKLSEELASGLDIPVELYFCLDKFQFDGQLPASPERFTALLGALADEASSQQPALDFLNPRQPPYVATRGEKTVRYGVLCTAALALIAIIVSGLYLMKSRTLAAEKEKSRNLDSQITEATDLAAKRQLLETFRDNNMVWLDEIFLLSEHFPSSDEAIVRVMRMSNQSNGGGRITMDVNVDAVKTMEPMENDLRKHFAIVRSDGVKPDEDNPNYTTMFKQTLDVQTRSQKEAARRAETAAAPTAEPVTETTSTESTR